MLYKTAILSSIALLLQGVTSSSVASLTTDKFDDFINSNDITLVEFFAPWCGHCKNLAPKYEAAASKLSAEGSDIQLASVDCTVEKDLCSKYGVGGYPTLKVFRSGGSAPTDYKGGRETDSIVSYMKKQSQPAIVDISKEADITQLVKNGDNVVVIGVFDDSDNDSIDAFKSVASNLRNDYTFGIVVGSNAKTIADHFNTHTNTAVLLKRSEPDTPYVYDQPFDVDTLSQYINNESFDLIGNIGPENYQKYIERGIPLLWMFLDETKDSVSDFITGVTDVAKEYKNKISMVRLDGVKWAEHGKHFGIKAGELPGLVIEDRSVNKNYVYPFGSSLKDSDIGGWIKSYLDKTLTPTMKSAEIPADNNGPLITVVGKTFDQIVLDDSKDVLVEFYAPWCGHCKSLAPKYKELAELYDDNENIVIAAVDATENDVPAKIQGFPTIIFYPAGEKQNPITYNGDRSVDDLNEFIQKNANTLKNSQYATEEHVHDDL